MSDDPNRPFMIGRPMTEAEQQCDCGCMDIERGPVGDLTFYREPTWPPKDAGVEPGYLVIWSEGAAACRVIPAALLHDGEGRFVTQIDQAGACDGTIADDS